MNDIFTTTGARLSQSDGYSRGGSRKYFLVIPIPEGRIYTGKQGTAMEYQQVHRFSAPSYAEALEHARAYLAKWQRQRD